MRLVGPPGFQSHLSALVLFCQLAHLIFTFTLNFVLPSTFYFFCIIFSNFSSAEPPMCARPFSMLWHGRKSGAATLTRSCARWSCVVRVLPLLLNFACFSHLSVVDFQLEQIMVLELSIFLPKYFSCLCSCICWLCCYIDS